jgi:AI-2 transport protein TqsA
MQPPGSLSPGLRVFLFTASVVITVAGLRLGSTLLVPLALALFITVVSLPLMNRLMQRNVPAGLAVLVVLLLDVTALLAVAWILVRALTDVGTAVAIYITRFGELEESVLQWFADHGVELGVITTIELIPVEPLLGMVTVFVRGTTDTLATAFLVALVAIFLLAEAPGFPAKLRLALGDRGASVMWLEGVMAEIQRYLALKTMISAATGLLIGVSAWLLGVDFALLWGLLAFLLNFIPNVGSLLAAIPAVLIAVLQHGFGTALALAAVYLVVNMLLGNLAEPALLGRRLGLSPAVVILSLVFWGWVWGAVGMFLSVPLTMIVKIVLEHTTDYRWIAAVMTGNAKLPGRAAVLRRLDSHTRDPLSSGRSDL